MDTVGNKITWLVVVGLTASIGCAYDTGSDLADARLPPAAHDDERDGIYHMTGAEDPLAGCVGCHGAMLTGGDGPSCYDCHDDSDHQVVRRGRAHKGGTIESCSACHGPANSGGLGPSCSTCH